MSLVPRCHCGMLRLDTGGASSVYKQWLGDESVKTVIALRTELTVICVTSMLQSCLGSSHFACQLRA